MNNVPLVLVRWRDAWSDNADCRLVDLEKLPGSARLYTVGFLVRRTKEALYLAQDFLPGMPESSEPEDSWRGWTIIPRSIVAEIKVLRKRLT